MSDLVWIWLDNALDYGLSEKEFWDMTISELERYFKSRRRVREFEAKQQANFDYILADLIGRSVSRCFNANNTYPKIEEVYSSLFDAEEMDDLRAKRQDELSALRFRHFVSQYNSRFNGGAEKDE